MKDACAETFSPTLREWFQMTRSVKSCPASECGQSPDLSDVDNSVDTTAEPYSGFPTPDNSPRLLDSQKSMLSSWEHGRTKLSSNAAPFNPASVNQGTAWYAVPIQPIQYMRRPWPPYPAPEHPPNLSCLEPSCSWGTQCTPCTFFHSQGCAKGKECNFCHSCRPRDWPQAES